MAKQDSTKTSGNSDDSDDDESLRRGSTTVVLVLVAPVAPNLGTPPKPKDEAHTSLRNTSLEVHVMTPDRKPVQGARVTARWHPRPSGAWKELPPRFTDASGKVRFLSLPLSKGQSGIEELTVVGGRGLSARKTALIRA